MPSLVHYHLVIYNMKSDFLLKCTLRFFVLKFDLNVKHRSYFSYKNLPKKHLIEKNIKKLLNYMLYTDDVTCNLSR